MFCRLLGNIVKHKIRVENTCSALDYLASGTTDGNTAFHFIDVICEREGKRNGTDVGGSMLHQVVLKKP